MGNLFLLVGRGHFSAIAILRELKTRPSIEWSLLLRSCVNLIDTANNVLDRSWQRRSLVKRLLGAAEDILVSLKLVMKIGVGPNDEGASRWHFDPRSASGPLKRLRRDHIDHLSIYMSGMVQTRVEQRQWRRLIH